MMVVGLAAVAGLVFAVRSIVIAWRLSTPVPFEDQWEFGGDVMQLRDGHYGLLDLFSLQN